VLLPGTQRLVAAVHDRASDHRRLLAAVRALEGPPPASQQPTIAPRAIGANETAWPTARDEMASARRFIGKPRVERDAQHRSIGFLTAPHTRTLPKHAHHSKRLTPSQAPDSSGQASPLYSLEFAYEPRLTIFVGCSSFLIHKINAHIAPACQHRLLETFPSPLRNLQRTPPTPQPLVGAREQRH